MIKVFNLIGKLLLGTFENLGKITLFFFMSFFWLFKKPFYFKQFLYQFLDIAFYSLPVVGLTTFFQEWYSLCKLFQDLITLMMKPQYQK